MHTRGYSGFVAAVVHDRTGTWPPTVIRVTNHDSPLGLNPGGTCRFGVLLRWDALTTSSIFLLSFSSTIPALSLLLLAIENQLY